MRHLALLALVAGIATACAAPAGPGQTTAATAVVGTPAFVPPAATAVAGTTAAVPGDVTLRDIGGNAPVSGTAHFAPAGDDQVAITVDLTGTSQLMPFKDKVTVAVLAGTCADLKEPADIAGSIGYDALDIVGGSSTEPVVVPLAAVTGAPTSILIANAPGDVNLACGDIGS